MKLYAMDIDCFTLLRKPDGKVARRVLEIGDSARIAITDITKIEQLQGRFQQVITAESGEKLLIAYAQWKLSETTLHQFRTVSIDNRSAEIFDELRKHKTARRTGRRDLLIGCICLAHGATVVTRNVKDFEKIPGLKIEN